MRIAQVAPLHERVPPLLYGGTERIVSYLTEELVRLGHEVTLFASGDSITSARLEAGSPRALRLDEDCRDPLAPHVRMLDRVYRRADEFDIIHSHTDYIGLPLTRTVSTPTVLTLHGRLDMPEVAPLYLDYPELAFVSISNDQRRPVPDLGWAATIYHGLPRDLYSFSATAEPSLLFVGRMSPEKRPDSAIRIAIRAGMRLKIAAKVDRADREYFESTIRPMLDHPLIEFLGEVDERRKHELLAGAQALLFPVDWPEPFGLVMIESLACGTPVIARRRGSVPEILDHGKTGFICETEEEMAEAAKAAAGLSRTHCRAELERRFSVEVMTSHYLALYRQLTQTTCDRSDADPRRQESELA